MRAITTLSDSSGRFSGTKGPPTMSTGSRNRSSRPPNVPNLGVPPPIAAPTKDASPEPGLTMSITHRLNTGGSVQALTILDNECLIAWLQGGRILVSCCPFAHFRAAELRAEQLQLNDRAGMVAQHLPASSLSPGSPRRSRKSVHLWRWPATLLWWC